MKILYVAVDTRIPDSHGGSVHVQELCRALGQRGHEVHLLAPKGESELSPDESDGNHSIRLCAGAPSRQADTFF